MRIKTEWVAFQTSFVGLTGNIEFNERGERVNVGVELKRLSQSEVVEDIGTWNEQKKRFDIKDDQMDESNEQKVSNMKHIIITSIVEAPFLQKKVGPDAEGLSGNDLYEGYCVSLIELLAEDLQFTYEIREVKDGEYGTELKKANETEDGKPVWNGMIGEVMRGVSHDVISCSSSIDSPVLCCRKQTWQWLLSPSTPTDSELWPSASPS